MLFLFRPSFGTGEGGPPPVVIPLPGTNDANNYQPVARKFEKRIPTFEESRNVKVVEAIEVPSIEPVKEKPKVTLNEIAEVALTVPAKEILSVLTVTTPISQDPLEEKIRQLEVKQLANEQLLDQLNQQIQEAQTAIPRKQEKLEALNNRLKRIQEEKEAALKKMQLEAEEEEAALLYLLLD